MRIAAIALLTLVLQAASPNASARGHLHKSGRSRNGLKQVATRESSILPHSHLIRRRSTWWHRATISWGRSKTHGVCIRSYRHAATVIRGVGSDARRTRS